MSAHNTAAWRLFNVWYHVYIPAYALMTETDHEWFGLVMDSDERTNQVLASEMTFYTMPAFEMAIHHDNGVPFAFADVADSLRIYMDILEHLKNWAEEAPRRARSKVPLVGLRQFNALATVVIDHAKRNGLIDNITGTITGTSNNRMLTRDSSRFSEIDLKQMSHPQELLETIEKYIGHDRNPLLTRGIYAR